MLLRLSVISHSDEFHGLANSCIKTHLFVLLFSLFAPDMAPCAVTAVPDYPAAPSISICSACFPFSLEPILIPFGLKPKSQ